MLKSIHLAHINLSEAQELVDYRSERLQALGRYKMLVHYALESQATLPGHLLLHQKGSMQSSLPVEGCIRLYLLAVCLQEGLEFRICS